jgi:hypothetical protein
MSSKKLDEITVYKTPEGEVRWTRKTTTNYRIVGASTQGYNSLQAAMDNIDRTQKGPFTLKKAYARTKQATI